MRSLKHCGTTSHDTERNAKRVVSQLTKSPEAAQQMSSSGHYTQKRRL